MITESTHICGYNSCGKRFKFKHDLLRHQTKVHGRQPVNRSRRIAGPRVTDDDDDDDDDLHGSGYFDG